MALRNKTDVCFHRWLPRLLSTLDLQKLSPPKSSTMEAIPTKSQQSLLLCLRNSLDTALQEVRISLRKFEIWPEVLPWEAIRNSKKVYLTDWLKPVGFWALVFSSYLRLCWLQFLSTVMRNVLLFPTKMLYPANLPVTTVLETLHRDKSANHKRLKVFWIVFTCLLVWELIPEVIHISSPMIVRI